jgi:hypothetical protein
MSALDAMERFWQQLGRPQFGYANAGFSSIGDALSRASQGYSQRRQVAKVGPTGVIGRTSTLWRVGPQPVAGLTAAATPGGTAHAKTDTGAINYNNPASGTLHLVGADFSASVINNSLLMYDRLFSVLKTPSSLATEAVTGVPTRYQSTTATDDAYIGDNFGFIEAFSALGSFAHNWTVCQYVNQTGTGTATLPSVAGNNPQIIDTLDQPLQQWFLPLASGDVGIRNWTQLQCSVNTITGSALFCIGHPIGFMSFPVINSVLPFDWLTNRDQAPRIFDNACLAFLEPLKPATTTTTYSGRFQMTGAAP